MSKKKYHKKNYRYYILTFIIICLTLFLVFESFNYLTTSKTERDLKKLKYSNTSISLIIDKKLDKYLINNNIYSKTLEVALTEGMYDSKYLKEYIDLPYKSYGNYIKQLNSLSDLGYNEEDIEQVFKILNKNDIDVIIKENKMISNITGYINAEYFDINNLNRYVAYKQKNSSYDYSKVVLNVNMYLDYPYYTHDINVDDPDNNLLVIVNKYYKLSSSYAPKGLVKIDADHSYSNNEYLVLPIVKENFDKIAADMEKLGMGIEVKSAYRSYQTQVQLYNDYVKLNGKEGADTFSARAGYSEHQTGLAIDVKTKDGSYATFETSKEYEWMKNNSYKYGFILRYPKDKTNITGYKFESWHFRYVGNDVAKYIYDHNITFDEYYVTHIANKKTK